MKTALVAIYAVFALLFVSTARADETDSNVLVVNSANSTLASCLTAVTQGAAGLSADAKVLLVAQAPRMCREAVVAPQIKQGPTTAHYVWDGFKFALGIWAGYKDKQMMWGALTGIVDRMADSSDNAVNQGFGVANTAIEQPPYIVAPSVTGELNLISPAAE